MKGFQPIQDTQEIVVAKLRGSDKGFQPIQVTQERVVGKRWVTNSYMFTGELIQGTQERVVVIEWVITPMGYTGESGGKMKGYILTAMGYRGESAWQKAPRSFITQDSGEKVDYPTVVP